MRNPSSYKALRGASTLNGWIPVRRISLASRGTWLSGVLRSSLRISVGGLVGGGRGYRGDTAELGLLEDGDDSSETSLQPYSDFGGVGGIWNDIDDKFRVGFFVCNAGDGGAVGRAVGTTSVDMVEDCRV